MDGDLLALGSFRYPDASLAIWAGNISRELLFPGIFPPVQAIFPLAFQHHRASIMISAIKRCAASMFGAAMIFLATSSEILMVQDGAPD